MKDIDVVGLIKLLLGILTPAAAFYAVGYVVTQAYVTTTGLQASFWFTESFYREAGARFFLDVVTAVALLPHLFILLTALFLWLNPGDMRALWRYACAARRLRFSLPRGAVLKEGGFLVAILSVVGTVLLVLEDCGESKCAALVEMPKWLFTSSWLFRGAQDRWLDQQPLLFPMAVFLALAIPTVVTLGLWAYQTVPSKGKTRRTNAETPHPVLAILVLSVFIVLSAYIPIAYGTYFYDFIVVSLVDRNKCAVETESTAGTAVRNGYRQERSQERSTLLQCYLLGRFDTRYILIGREEQGSPPPTGTGEQTDQRIYIKQVEKLEPFAIESTTGSPLRSLTNL